MTTFVPQQMVADRDLQRMIDGNRAAQRYDQFAQEYQQTPVINMPNGYMPGMQLMMPEQYRSQQTRMGGHAEQLNGEIERIENERRAMLNMHQPPHMFQQRSSAWNPIQTQRIQQQGLGDQTQNYLQALQQQRSAENVRMRQPLF